MKVDLQKYRIVFAPENKLEEATLNEFLIKEWVVVSAGYKIEAMVNGHHHWLEVYELKEARTM